MIGLLVIGGIHRYEVLRVHTITLTELGSAVMHQSGQRKERVFCEHLRKDQIILPGQVYICVSNSVAIVMPPIQLKLTPYVSAGDPYEELWMKKGDGLSWTAYFRNGQWTSAQINAPYMPSVRPLSSQDREMLDTIYELITEYHSDAQRIAAEQQQKTVPPMQASA